MSEYEFLTLHHILKVPILSCYCARDGVKEEFANSLLITLHNLIWLQESAQRIMLISLTLAKQAAINNDFGVTPKRRITVMLI